MLLPERCLYQPLPHLAPQTFERGTPSAFPSRALYATPSCNSSPSRSFFSWFYPSPAPVAARLVGSPSAPLHPVLSGSRTGLLPLPFKFLLVVLLHDLAVLLAHGHHARSQIPCFWTFFSASRSFHRDAQDRFGLMTLVGVAVLSLAAPVLAKKGAPEFAIGTGKQIQDQP